MPLDPNMNRKLLIGPSIIAVGLVFHTIGQATPYWTSVTLPVMDITQNIGLWEVCVPKGCVRIPIDSPDLTPSYHASRAFAIMGVLSGAAAVLAIFLYVFQAKLIYATVSSALGALSGFLIAVCIIVWAAYISDKCEDISYSHGFSYAFSCVGCILSVAGSIVAHFSNRRHHNLGYQAIGSS
ncbi:uncharacterized protein LOC131944798 [Physella acuta]|uniref:uncharacterized protein LOC131944798 n=1 Tax=Physella acuta TaxID=109671 RepID=UPI0027DC2216|nr:uncharacterized protein LOC131944798 [Physella acuta]